MRASVPASFPTAAAVPARPGRIFASISVLRRQDPVCSLSSRGSRSPADLRTNLCSIRLSASRAPGAQLPPPNFHFCSEIFLFPPINLSPTAAVRFSVHQQFLRRPILVRSASVLFSCISVLVNW
jgi:hypothetical protein